MSRQITPLAGLALIAMGALISACGSDTPAATGAAATTSSSTTTTATTTTAATTTAAAATTTPAGESASTGQTPQQSTGQQLSPAQKHAWLSWAKCIRVHGMPNFADPTFPADVPGAVALSGAFGGHGSGPRSRARGRGPVSSSPQLQSALNACKTQLPSTRGLGG